MKFHRRYVDTQSIMKGFVQIIDLELHDEQYLTVNVFDVL